MRVKHLVAALVLGFVVEMPVAAQPNTAEISGIVRDAQGFVLPGVTVVAAHVATGRHRELRPDFQREKPARDAVGPADELLEVLCGHIMARIIRHHRAYEPDRSAPCE